MTRVATAETEEYLLQIARHGTAVHLEKVVRHYRRVVEEETLERAEQQFNERSFEQYYEDDNTLVIKVRLPAEQGEVVTTAIDQMVDEEIQQERERNGTLGCCAKHRPEDDLYDGPAGPQAETPKPTRSQRRADAFSRLALAHLETTGSKKTGKPYQVVVHIDQTTLNEGKAGLCELENGPELATETVKRICCDAEVIEVVEDDFGEPLNVGRSRRTMPTALATGP